MRKATFLISALCLLILANVLMMSYASPAFKATGEGFVGHMAKPKKEGFMNYKPAAAKGAYQPIGSFDGVTLDKANEWRYTAPNEPLKAPQGELGPDNMFIFKNNQCKPECCGATFSCDGGCVCTTPDQRNFINARWGNPTGGSDCGK